MGEEGFEPSRIATVDLETTSLTTRTSAHYMSFYVLCVICIFVFLFVGAIVYLRSRDDRLLGLDVVAVEVLLEVEVSERLTLAD